MSCIFWRSTVTTRSFIAKLCTNETEAIRWYDYRNVTSSLLDSIRVEHAHSRGTLKRVTRSHFCGAGEKAGIGRGARNRLTQISLLPSRGNVSFSLRYVARAEEISLSTTLLVCGFTSTRYKPTDSVHRCKYNTYDKEWIYHEMYCIISCHGLWYEYNIRGKFFQILTSFERS